MTVFAAAADDSAAISGDGAADSSAQFVDPDSDPNLEAELDAADLAAEREESEVAAVGADADTADTGAQADIADEAADVETAEEAADVNVIESGADVDVEPEGAVIDIEESGAEIEETETGTISILRTVLAIGDGRNIRFPSYMYWSTSVPNGVLSSYAISNGFHITGRRTGTVLIKIYTDSSYYGTIYWYVAVVNRGGSYSMFNAPTIKSFASLASGVKITWAKITGVEMYRVYYKSSSGWKKLGDTTGTSLIDKDVRSGATYKYTVRCMNSERSAFASGYSTGGWKYTYNMSTPKISSITSLSNGVYIRWGSVANAVKYRVYYKSGSSWKKLGDTTGTSFLDKKVSFGKTYRYTVRCINSSGSRFTSAYSKSGWAWKHYLSTPSLTKAYLSSAGMRIYWNKVSGAARYRVYRKTSSGWKAIGDTTGTNFLDYNVTYGKYYTYTVRCVNSAGTKFTSDFKKAGWTIRYAY